MTLVLLRREHDYLHWFWPVLVGIIGAAVVMMLWQPRVARTAIAVGLATLLVVPAIYSATAWQVPVNGTFPTAGPYIEDDTEALGIPADQIPIYRQLLFYVRAHQPPSRWDVLTQGATTAAPLMLLGGRVAALGGYGTIDPVLTPPDLAALVSHGEVRFVALGGGYASNGGNAASTAVAHASTNPGAPAMNRGRACVPRDHGVDVAQSAEHRYPNPPGLRLSARRLEPDPLRLRGANRTTRAATLSDAQPGGFARR